MKDSGFDAMMFGRLKAGDEAAFKCLFEHYYVPLCLYSVQITESPEDSEDIVQDFFVRFWEKGFYRTVDTNLKSYLFNAVRNLSFNYLKKQRTYLADVSALSAASNCGVSLLATAHGGSLEELKWRSVSRTLLEEHIFQRLILIERNANGARHYRMEPFPC